MMNMSEEEWQHFKALENEIKLALKKAVLDGVDPDSDEAGRIVDLHNCLLYTSRCV